MTSLRGDAVLGNPVRGGAIEQTACARASSGLGLLVPSFAEESL